MTAEEQHRQEIRKRVEEAATTWIIDDQEMFKGIPLDGETPSLGFVRVMAHALIAHPKQKEPILLLYLGSPGDGYPGLMAFMLMDDEAIQAVSDVAIHSAQLNNESTIQ